MKQLFLLVVYIPASGDGSQHCKVGKQSVTEAMLEVRTDTAQQVAAEMFKHLSYASQRNSQNDV